MNMWHVTETPSGNRSSGLTTGEAGVFQDGDVLVFVASANVWEAASQNGEFPEDGDRAVIEHARNS